MKKTTDLSFRKIALIAVATELVLITIQLINLGLYVRNHPGTKAEFSTEYIMNSGFFIYQVLGFFLYVTLVYVLAGRITSRLIQKLIVFVLAGGAAELLFYLTIQADYQGAFLYSIFDKLIATAFGLIVFNYTTNQRKSPEMYL
jgi:hypothetical protein